MYRYAIGTELVIFFFTLLLLLLFVCYCCCNKTKYEVAMMIDIESIHLNPALSSVCKNMQEPMARMKICIQLLFAL